MESNLDPEYHSAPESRLQKSNSNDMPNKNGEKYVSPSTSLPALAYEQKEARNSGFDAESKKLKKLAETRTISPEANEASATNGYITMSSEMFHQHQTGNWKI